MGERIETGRLLLRPWKADDRNEAASLFRYASDPQIGLLCGWPPHGSPEESMEVIRDVFSAEHNWAIVIADAAAKNVADNGEPVGCIELKPLSHIDGFGKANSASYERYGGYLGSNALELGYWLGRPFWGRGYMSEALNAVLGYAFETLRKDAVWGVHYVENDRSGRVMARCGMRVVGELKHRHFPLIDEYHDEVLRIITAGDWNARKRVR